MISSSTSTAYARLKMISAAMNANSTARSLRPLVDRFPLSGGVLDRPFHDWRELGSAATQDLLEEPLSVMPAGEVPPVPSGVGLPSSAAIRDSIHVAGTHETSPNRDE